VLPAPVVPLLVLGALEPPALEPVLLPCCCRQRSFSAPVMLSHWMVLPPTLGEEVDELPVDELPVAPDEDGADGEPDAPVEPPTLCDDDWAIAAAEKANNAAMVVAEIALSIFTSPMRVSGTGRLASERTQASCLQRGALEVPAPEPMPVLSGPERREDSVLSIASLMQRAFASSRSDSHCFVSARCGGDLGAITSGPPRIWLPLPCAKLTPAQSSAAMAMGYVPII
jgi:hypothetical protein